MVLGTITLEVAEQLEVVVVVGTVTLVAVVVGTVTLVPAMAIEITIIAQKDLPPMDPESDRQPVPALLVTIIIAATKVGEIHSNDKIREIRSHEICTNDKIHEILSHEIRSNANVREIHSLVKTREAPIEDKRIDPTLVTKVDPLVPHANKIHLQFLQTCCQERSTRFLHPLRFLMNMMLATTHRTSLTSRSE